MNKLSGHISSIISHGALSRVVVTLTDKQQLQAVVIENPETADYLKKGAAVNLVFKETEVILCPEGSPLMSIANRIPARVSGIQRGKILSRVDLEWKGGRLSAITDSEAMEAMALEKGISLLVVIPFNQIMLQPA